MALINVSSLTFAYDDSYGNVFENVSLQIDSSWKLGLIGRNGKGKTTFLNLLLNRYEYSGVISSGVQFDIFPFEIEDRFDLTINVILRLAPDALDWEIRREISLLQVDNDRLFCPFEMLSGGEQVKVMLAALFLKDDKFLLIDEPTNHLDIQAKTLVERYLNSKSGFILVSHDRKLLDGCVDHILAINKANIELQKGNFSSWFENKKKMDQFELDQNEKLKKEIKRLEISAKQTANWSDKVEATKFGGKNKKSGLRPNRGYVGHKAAKMMKRSLCAQNRKEKAVEESSKLLKNIETIDLLKINNLKHHNRVLLSFNNVSLSYGEKTLVQNINFEVKSGDRVAIKGPNGCGKSTILKQILGTSEATIEGEICKASGLQTSYVSQEIEQLRGKLKDFVKKFGIDETLFKTILRKLDLSREQFEKDILSFSAGQKKKVLIAKSLCEPAHLFLWDEPLNYIDLFSRIQIEEILISSEAAIVFVDHDEAFVQSVATHTIDL